MRTISNNDVWLRSDRMTSQVNLSYAANAFRHFQLGLAHYELLRASRFWEKVDLDGHSLQTVAALCSRDDVREIVRAKGEEAYEAKSQSSIDYGKRALRSLDRANRIVRWYSGSQAHVRLETERNRIAHALRETRREKKAASPTKKPELREAARATQFAIRAIDHYHRSLNGSGFDFAGAQKMHDRHAALMWDNTKLNISG